MNKDTVKKYFDAWRAIYANEKLSRAELALLQVLKDTNFKDIWFSYATYAKKIGVTRRTAIRCVSHLIKLNYVNYNFSPKNEEFKKDRVILKLKGALKNPGLKEISGDMNVTNLIKDSDINDTSPVAWMSQSDDMDVTPSSDTAVTQMHDNKNVNNINDTNNNDYFLKKDNNLKTAPWVTTPTAANGALLNETQVDKYLIKYPSLTAEMIKYEARKAYQWIMDRKAIQINRVRFFNDWLGRVAQNVENARMTQRRKVGDYYGQK